MYWCFALVNNRTAEIYFDRTKNGRANILGHAYVKKSEFATVRERRQVVQDIACNRFSYRNGVYKKKVIESGGK